MVSLCFAFFKDFEYQVVNLPNYSFKYDLLEVGFEILSGEGSKYVFGFRSSFIGDYFAPISVFELNLEVLLEPTLYYSDRFFLVVKEKLICYIFTEVT